MGRKGRSIVLSASDQEELSVMAHSTKLDDRYIIRAKIILSLADGNTYDWIQQRYDVGREAVAKWKRRFIDDGIAGLQDKGGRGRKPIYGDDVRALVIQKGRKDTGIGYAHLSQRKIARQLKMSQSCVQKILKKNVLKFDTRAYWRGGSAEPEFAGKTLNVIGLYLSAGQNAVVLSIDAPEEFQAPGRLPRKITLHPANARRLTPNHKKKQTTSLIASLAGHQDDGHTPAATSNYSDHFLRFIKHLHKKYPGRHLYVVLDSFQGDHHQLVSNWIQRKQWISLHVTPTYDCWLNQLELWLGILTRDVLKGGIWHSKQQLIDQIKEYIVIFNRTRATPFAWVHID